MADLNVVLEFFQNKYDIYLGQSVENRQHTLERNRAARAQTQSACTDLHALGRTVHNTPLRNLYIDHRLATMRIHDFENGLQTSRGAAASTARDSKVAQADSKMRSQCTQLHKLIAAREQASEVIVPPPDFEDHVLQVMDSISELRDDPVTQAHVSIIAEQIFDIGNITKRSKRLQFLERVQREWASRQTGLESAQRNRNRNRNTQQVADGMRFLEFMIEYCGRLKSGAGQFPTLLDMLRVQEILLYAWRVLNASD